MRGCPAGRNTCGPAPHIPAKVYERPPSLGNEPAWNLEIGPDQQLVLSTELGQRRTATRHLEPVVDGARTTYRAANHGQDPTMVVERRACNDTMSGELFEAAVTVNFESVRLHGCGRWL